MYCALSPRTITMFSELTEVVFTSVPVWFSVPVSRNVLTRNEPEILVKKNVNKSIGL